LTSESAARNVRYRMRPFHYRCCAALAVVGAVACGDSAGPGGGTEATTGQAVGLVVATDGVTGSLALTFTGPTDVRSDIGGLYDGTATLTFANGDTATLTGSWREVSSPVTFANLILQGGGYLFEGPQPPGLGRFSGTGVQGAYALAPSSDAAPVIGYCGTITGTTTSAGRAMTTGWAWDMLVGAAAALILPGVSDADLDAGSVPYLLAVRSGNQLIVDYGANYRDSISFLGTIRDDKSAVAGVWTSIAYGQPLDLTWQASGAACVGSPGVSVASLTITPVLDTVAMADSGFAFATPLDAAGRYVGNAAVTWSADPAGRVRVDTVGLHLPGVRLTPLDTGTVTLTVAVGAVTATETVVIRP
jgi:hypothetical protein